MATNFIMNDNEINAKLLFFNWSLVNEDGLIAWSNKRLLLLIKETLLRLLSPHLSWSGHVKVGTNVVMDRLGVKVGVARAQGASHWFSEAGHAVAMLWHLAQAWLELFGAQTDGRIDLE